MGEQRLRVLRQTSKRCCTCSNGLPEADTVLVFIGHPPSRIAWTADDTNSFSRIHAGLPKGHEAPHLACLFFDAGDITEFAQGCITRFLRRHAACDVVLSLHLEVVADVVAEIVEHALAAIHGLFCCSAPCSAGRRIRAIAAASLSHLLVSA